MKVALASTMAPPFNLVVHFFIAGIFSLVLSVFMLPFLELQSENHFLSFSLAAFSHLYLLGFVMMIIFGALYQLLPVVLEVPIFSKKSAYVQFYIYFVGIVLLVLGFGIESLSFLIPYGAMMSYVAMLIFCVNVVLTFYTLKTLNLISKFLLFGVLFLGLSATKGMVIASHLGYGWFDIVVDEWVKAHMLGALGGFVMMVIMAVAMVLLPMFSLAHNYSKKYLENAFYLHVFGVSFGMLALVFGLKTILYIALIALICSCALFVVQMSLILKARARKQNDYWFKNIVFALICFVLSISLLSVMPLLGAILGFFGFLLPLIIGHMYKILPFLIWYKKFSPLVGKKPVPLLHQMIHSRVAEIQTGMLFIAICFLSLSMLLDILVLFYLGSCLLIVSIMLVLYDVGYSFYFFIKE